MQQRDFPEWSSEEVEYVEPTQVVRSFGYDVMANPIPNDFMDVIDDTFTCVLTAEGKVADKRYEYPDIASASSDIKQRAQEFGAYKTGITLLDRKYVYKDYDVPHKYVIVIAVPMEYEEIKYGATQKHVREVVTIYAKVGGVASKLAEYIRGKGYPARAHSLRFEQIVMLPHAQQAGLGELGKHGSLINRELGCSFRVACVSTDLPMALDGPVDEGIDAICANCNMCTEHCPGDAISADKQDIRGEKRWLVDTELCAPYWGSYFACGICLEVCPFNAKAQDGKYKTSFVERIKSIDVEQRTTDLNSCLQQPWSYVEKPKDHEAGWRNRLRGKGMAAMLIGGVPVIGIPKEVYRARETMGMYIDLKMKIRGVIFMVLHLITSRLTFLNKLFS